VLARGTRAAAAGFTTGSALVHGAGTAGTSGSAVTGSFDEPAAPRGTHTAANPVPHAPGPVPVGTYRFRAATPARSA
jgi:hypothetical protein